MTQQPPAEQPPRITSTLAGMDLLAPRTHAEQQALQALLWGAVPVPLTVNLGPHAITFYPGHASVLRTGAHRWGPFEVELTLDSTGHVAIERGRDLPTGAPLTTKLLLDLADCVHTALVADPDLGSLFRALNAVGHQRVTGDEADDDRAVTSAALAGLS